MRNRHDNDANLNACGKPTAVEVKVCACDVFVLCADLRAAAIASFQLVPHALEILLQRDHSIAVKIILLHILLAFLL